MGVSIPFPVIPTFWKQEDKSEMQNFPFSEIIHLKKPQTVCLSAFGHHGVTS